MEMQAMPVHDSAQEGAGVHQIESAVDHAPSSLYEGVAVGGALTQEVSRTGTIDENTDVDTEAANASQGHEKASADAPEASDVVAGENSQGLHFVKEVTSDESKGRPDCDIDTLGRGLAATGVPSLASVADGANPAADIHAPDIAGGLEIPAPEEDDIAFAAEAAANAVEEADQEQERLDQSRLRCRICGQGMLEGRPILRFLPMGHALSTPAIPLPGYPTVNTFDEEICLHIFCGKTASILPNVNQPDMEILTKAGLKNKHGIGPEVNAALARSRSAQIITILDGISTASQSAHNSKEKQYYLVREFEAHLATIRNAHSHQARSHLHSHNMATNRYPQSIAQTPSVNIPSPPNTAPIPATDIAQTHAATLSSLPVVNQVVLPQTSSTAPGTSLPPGVHSGNSVPNTLPPHSLKAHDALGVPPYGGPGAATTDPLYLPPHSGLLMSSHTDPPTQTPPQPPPMNYTYPVMSPPTTMFGAPPTAAGPPNTSPMIGAVSSTLNYTGINGIGSMPTFPSHDTGHTSIKAKNAHARMTGGKGIPVRASAGRTITKPLSAAKEPH